MACHELGALRLGLQKVLGINDEAAKDHDEREIGETLHQDGPIKSLANANNLNELRAFYQNSLSHLERKISESDNEKDLPYYRSLLILTKKVELELDAHIKSIDALYKGLDEIHDYVHEIYPS
ncbi:MAG: DUF3209 family protein [Bacteriovoracaceae bacterium]